MKLMTALILMWRFLLRTFPWVTFMTRKCYIQI
jgi:hypothetical protein